MTAMRRVQPPAARQSGVILLIVLVALVALLSAGIALVRSSDVGLLQAGNLAFQRDLYNQAERGIKAALAQFEGTGALASDASRNVSNKSINYSALRLGTDVRGIPLALLGQASFDGVGDAKNDVVDADSAVRVRTVIDRLCANSGAYSSASCTGLDPSIGRVPTPCDTKNCTPLSVGTLPVYRISVRATGPRNTQVFLQTTLAK